MDQLTWRWLGRRGLCRPTAFRYTIKTFKKKTDRFYGILNMSEIEVKTGTTELKKISKDELNKILEEHAKWLKKSENEEYGIEEVKKGDLSWINFDGEDFKGYRFESVNFEGSSFRNANLKRAHFYKANLQKANLEGAIIEGAFFQIAGRP